MKRGLVLIAGTLVLLGTGFYISTRLIHPPTPAAAVATLKQGKLNISIPTRPLNQPTAAAATVEQAKLDPASCSARLGSLTRCT
jgi:hypothetical protein